MEAKAKAGEEDLSMEEILQSIRKIIAEDDGDANVNGPAKNTAGSDVLELTEIMEEAPANAPAPKAAAPAAAAPAAAPAAPAPAATVEAPKAAMPASPPAAPANANDVLSKIDQVVMPEPPAKPVAPPPSAPAALTNGQAYIDSLLSSESATATSAAFKKIHPVEAPIVTTPSAQFRSGSSVEDLVLEALKPMLKSWLDANLPTIVERMVEREIKKLTS